MGVASMIAILLTDLIPVEEYALTAMTSPTFDRVLSVAVIQIILEVLFNGTLLFLQVAAASLIACLKAIQPRRVDTISPLKDIFVTEQNQSLIACAILLLTRVTE